MDENIQELRESMLRLTDVLGNQAQLIENQTRIMMAGMKQEDIDRLKLEQVFGKNTAAVEGNTGAVDRSSRAYKANLDAAEEYNKAMQNYAAALKGGADGLKKVFNNMIAQDPSRSMAKYSDALGTLGDAVSKAAENFGPLGKAVGATVQGFTKIAAMQMQQADLLLKANDQLAQFGTAGSFTTKELMDMAHGAGVTSKNMDTLINPIKSLGPALTSLGGTASDGVKAFTSMAKITNEQREGFQRLGVSQEQLIQNQADYVKLQMMSGKSMTNELKDRAALQRASLEYTENLLVLSNISGQDAESLKKKQQDAARAVEAQVAQIQLENKARRLEAEGRTEAAAAIRKEAEGRKKAIETMANFDEGAMKGVREFLSTGTATSEEGQALQRLGLGEELKKLKAEIAAGGDAQKATTKFQDAYNKAMINAVDKVGFSASRSADVAKAFNISENSLEQANAQRDRNITEELEAGKKKIEEAKKPGKDPAQDARAKLTTLEIEAGKAMDKLVGSINPLLKGFNAVTIGGTLAAAALTGLAVAAGKSMTAGIASKGADAVKNALGMAGKMGAPLATTVATGAAPAATAAASAAAPVAATAATAAGGAGTAATAATGAASALSKLAGPLAGLSKAAPLIGTVMSVGSGVVDAYQGIRKADKDLKEGKIDKEEAKIQKGEAIGGGVGTAAGGAGGAWAGAATGAAIGSVIPGLGTAVGGIIGAAIGGWLGSSAGKIVGEVAGGGIAQMSETADKEIDKAKQKAEEKSKKAETSAPVAKAFSMTEGSLPDSKIAQLERQREELEKRGPRTSTQQSKESHAEMLKTLDMALEAERAKLKSAPKAAVGGIFEGPKSGYPVELHGKEMVTPLGTGTKTAGLGSHLEDERDEELEEEIEALSALKKTMRETDASFDRLTASVIKLNKLEEEKLESTEDQVDGLEGVNDKLKNVFNNVGLDLSKFATNIKVVTRETSSSGTGMKAPEGLGGILGGTAGGGTSAPAGGAEGGTGLKPPSAPPIPSMGGGTGVTAPPVKQDIKQNLGDVKAALMKRGMGDEKYLNAVLGNVMKESGGKVINENLNYGKTSNDRIRAIFGSRASGKTDEELNAIKSNPESMGEFMYGKDTKIGRSMGNLEPGDGFKYRGRGYIQLTGKANYAAASQAIFGDDTLVKNPDLVNDPKIAADVVAWYMEKGKARMAKAMGIDDKNMTQEQANLLATSQIAGGDVRKKGSYLAGEVMNKVTAYAGSKDIQGIQPTSGGTMVASADSKKSEIPKAQKGGVFEGPDSGYLVELHGNETVIPTDKIASIAKTGIESSDMLKKIMPAGVATADSLMPATAPSEEIVSMLGESLKEMTNSTNNTIIETLKSMQDEFKLAITQLTQQSSPTEVGTSAESVTELLNSKLDLMIDKLSQSNDTQDKLLQYSKV